MIIPQMLKTKQQLESFGPQIRGIYLNSSYTKEAETLYK